MIQKITLIILLLSVTIGVKAQGILLENEQNNELTIKKYKNKYAILKSNGEKVLPYLDTVWFDKNASIYIVKYNSLWGVLNKNGYTTIPILFEKLDHIFNEYWLVEKNKKKGVYSRMGHLIIPVEYDTIEFTTKVNKEFKVRKGNKFGIINGNGTVVVPIKYESITDNDDILLTLKLNNKTEYFMGGKIITDSLVGGKTVIVRGEYADDTKYYFAVCKDNKYGIIDNTGAQIIDVMYQDILSKRLFFRTKEPIYFYVKLNNLWGAVDNQNNVIVPFEYSNIESVSAIIIKK